MANSSTDVLIVGAGPFGLSLAAYLTHLGIEHRVVGEPMAFWNRHMPRGMLLRSGLDWHLDALGEKTLEAYVAARGLAADAVQPIGLDFYLDYARWFQDENVVRPEPVRVAELRRHRHGGFVADCGDSEIAARHVVVATGFRDFAHVPPELAALLPPGSYGHTCDVVDLESFAGKSVLIVGGRQSAFEWAALLADAGARRVDVTYRHDTPSFEESDWSWVGALMRRTEADPGWYRRLDEEERIELGRRFWAEGRLKLEPWLAPRIDKSSVHMWPRTTVAAASPRAAGAAITLDNGTELESDFVILATGYQVDLNRIPFLAAGDLLGDVERHRDVGGAPALGEDLQSSVSGLYFTSMAATADFGPFFAFTVSATCSTKLIGESLRRRVGEGRE
jgi:FAD-dependent urate hydroxylase